MNLLALIPLLVASRLGYGFKVGWRTLPANERYSNLGESQTEVFQKNLLKGMRNLAVHYADVILIFGKVNSGKSSLACFLSGQNLTVVDTTLTVKMIDDHDRIGEVHPWTLFPDLFLSERAKMAFYDLPGHTIDNDAGFDSLSKFFTYRLLRFLKYIRILAVFNYRNFKDERGVAHEIFDIVRYRLGEIGFDKYYVSIGLAVSFLPLSLDGKKILSDQLYRQALRELLQRTHDSVDRDYGQFEKLIREKIKLLLRHFIQHYNETVLFRIPYKKGNVHEMTTHLNAHLVAERLLYLKQLHISIQNFSLFRNIIQGADFQIYIDNAKDVINTGLSKLSEIVKEYFRDIVKNSVNHNETIGLLGNWTEKYDAIIEDIKYSCSSSRDGCIAKIFQKVREMKIKHPRNLEFKTTTNYKYLEFVETLRLKKYEPVKTKDWVGKFSDILNYLIFSKNYLAVLIQYQNKTSTGNYENNNKIIKDPPERSCCGNYVLKKSTRHAKVGLLKSIYVRNLPKEGIENNAHQIDKYHIMLADDSKTFAKRVEMEHECATGWNYKQILRIKGLYLDFDYISNNIFKYNLKSFCRGNEGPLFRIEFYALHHIKINRDFTDLFERTFTDLPLEVAIISPNWIVDNEVKINLNGKDGEMRNHTANNKTGTPGWPGEPAAAFLGIGLTFQRAHQLTVTSVGGKGGRGNNGLPGDNGGRAEDYYYQWNDTYCVGFLSEWCIFSPMALWEGYRYYGSSFLGWYGIKGLAGKPGEKGGDGGRGGHAGYGNEMILINLGYEKPSIKTIGGFGENGTNGTGAQGGMGGKHECDFLCWRLYILWMKVDVRIWTYCDYTESHHGFRYYGRAKSGQRGVDGGGTLNITNAKESIPYLFPHRTVNEYKNFLIKNFGYRTKINEFIKYYYDLENNEQVENLYTLEGYNQNFIILEINFFKFVDDSEYIKFYNSLDRRINKFNVNKVNMYEGKTINVLQCKFQNFTDEEVAIAVVNNIKAMSILNATLIRKIKYLRYMKGRDTILKNPIQHLLELNETIKSHFNLSSVVKERKKVIRKLATLYTNLDAMNQIINKEFKPKFLSLMKQIKAGMTNLVEEVDKMIEKIRDEVAKRRLLSIIKLVIGAVSAILMCIPGIGMAGSLALAAVGGVATAVVNEFKPPPFKLPAGVTNSLSPKKSIDVPTKENVTCAAEQLRKMIETCRDKEKKEELIKKLSKVKDIIPKIKKMVKLERLPELINNGLQSLLKTKKVGFLTPGEVYKVLERLNLVDRIPFLKFMKTIPGIKNFTPKVINDFISTFAKHKLGILITNLMHRVNVALSKIILGAVKVIEKVFKILRTIVITAIPVIGPFLAVIGIAITLESDTKEIQSEESKLVNLLEFKRKITDTTMPAIDSMANNVELADFKEMTEEQFYQLVNSIQDLSDTIEEMVSEFKIGSKMESLTTQIADILSKFREQFDDIQEAKSEIRDLKSQQEKLASLDGIKDNVHLGDSVIDVKLASTMNDIFIAWEEAAQTVKVLFFPRENPYKVDFDVSSIRKIPSSEFDYYVRKVQKAIAELLELFRNSKHPSNYIKFENDYKNSSYHPFYSWYKHSHEEQLKKLFSGETVYFTAHVNTTSHNYHAVKFGDIGIGFTIKLNHTVDEKRKMKKALKSIKECVLNLTKFGISEYKCAKLERRVPTQIYRFSHSLDVSVKKNVSVKMSPTVTNYINVTNYTYENEDYKNLKKLPPMLSPYGSWNISIQCKDEKKQLYKLIDLVDMHLTGYGTYTLIEECP